MRILQDGAWIFGNDLNALVEAFKGNAVESGCSVSDGGSTDMTVAVAAGVIEAAGVRVAVAGNNVVLATASAFKRYDLIVVNNTGIASKVDGTVEKKAPDIPSGFVLLAIVEVPGGATGVANANIYDCRVMDRAGAAYESADGDYVIDVDADGNGSGAVKLRVNGTDRLTISNAGAVAITGTLSVSDGLIGNVGIGGPTSAAFAAYFQGTVTGPSTEAASIRFNNTLKVSAASGGLFHIYSNSGTFHANGFASQAVGGSFIDLSGYTFTTGGAGSFTSSYVYYAKAATGAAINYAYYAQSGVSQFNGDIQIRGANYLDHSPSALINLGGGAAATLGTIGGTGPTAAAQAKWIQVKANGSTYWVPAWA